VMQDLIYMQKIGTAQKIGENRDSDYFLKEKIGTATIFLTN